VALERVSLDIHDGEFVALLGASGCGKTTILNLIADLIAPTTGVIEVNGLAPMCPNLEIGYMFARDALLPWRKVSKNVELGLEVRAGWSHSRRRQRAAEMLELVGLTAAARRYPIQLSQGMRQRVALARVLAVDPKILLMDEPFAALDAHTRLDIQAEFLRIWELVAASSDHTKKTVVFVTHDLQEAALLADRVLVMYPNPGRIGFERRIDLPRPRADHLGSIMFTEEFRTIHHELFDALKHQQKRAEA
jgi:NitT/TauT family transport system ATP-binding protein